jgi:transcriptional antiterminator
MVYVKKVINQDLKRLFEEGKTESEAFDVLSKTYSSHEISLKIVTVWFKKLSSGEQHKGNKKIGRKLKFTDEYLINLINENPQSNITELSILANTSRNTISRRLKQINSCKQRVSYIDKGFKKGVKKFTDNYLINLINENPDLNMEELAKLANTCTSNISVRLKKINCNRPNDNKIVLKKNRSKTERNSRKFISNDSLIKLVNENPELNVRQLAILADVSTQTIYSKLNKINADVERVSYIKKSKKNGATKFTDEFIINLINENPEFNMEELAKFANTTQATISNRIKQINIDGGEVNYFSKNIIKGSKSQADEYLIKLVNENPDLNITELAKLSGISRQTISSSIKRINLDGEKSIIVKKGRKKFTDEFLIRLINDNPMLNISELAKLANSSPRTISNRLKEINSNGERVKYIYK